MSQVNNLITELTNLHQEILSEDTKLLLSGEHSETIQILDAIGLTNHMDKENHKKKKIDVKRSYKEKYNTAILDEEFIRDFCLTYGFVARVGNEFQGQVSLEAANNIANFLKNNNIVIGHGKGTSNSDFQIVTSCIYFRPSLAKDALRKGNALVLYKLPENLWALVHAWDGENLFIRKYAFKFYKTFLFRWLCWLIHPVIGIISFYLIYKIGVFIISHYYPANAAVYTVNYRVAILIIVGIYALGMSFSKGFWDSYIFFKEKNIYYKWKEYLSDNLIIL